MYLLAIQSCLRAGIGDRALRVGPFLTTIDQHTDNPSRNYAVPDDGAAPTTADLNRLVALFAARDRMPRLEYVAPAPELEAALIAAGFAVESHLPLMSVDPAEVRAPRAPAGVEVAMVTAEADLWRAAAVQNAAYGEPAGATQADVNRLRGTVTAGGGVALAFRPDSGEAVGAGLYTVPRHGLTEVAAIGVRAAHRRQGIATALCHELTRAGVACGATPFLQAEAEPEQRAYGRVGYRLVGELTVASHRSLPARPIPGPRLTLRPVSPVAARRILAGDIAGAVADLAGNVVGGTAAAMVARTVAGQGWPHPDTHDALRQAGDHGAAVWLVIDEDGVIVGDAGTGGPVDASGRVEIGYGLAEPYRGRGFGGELVSTLSQWLLWQPAVRRVVAEVAAGNTPSRRALERAGFVGESTGSGACRYALWDHGDGVGSDPAESDRPVDHRPPRIVGDERDTLLAFLGYLRECLVAKCTGLSEPDARRSPVPSGTSLLGLVKHVAAVEVMWLHHTFAGHDPLVIIDDALGDSDTVESVIVHYRAVAAVSDQIVRGCADADQVAAVAPFGPPRTTLRWILTHLVEEVGRHAGHADILREQLDGSVGR